MVGERVKGETELGYAYFKIYRDMEPDDRALSKLCDIAVNGKKGPSPSLLDGPPLSTGKTELGIGMFSGHAIRYAR